MDINDDLLGKDTADTHNVTSKLHKSFSKWKLVIKRPPKIITRKKKWKKNEKKMLTHEKFSKKIALTWHKCDKINYGHKY